MTRPMVEITEEMEAWARWYVSGDDRSPKPGRPTRAVATAILAALPQPPRPLAVGDVVDRVHHDDEGFIWDPQEELTVEALGPDWAIFRGESLPYFMRKGAYRRVRVGESEPAPWPWTVES